MSATWSLNVKDFKDNAKNMIVDTPTIAVVKNNAYNFDLKFVVETFRAIGISAFATTSLKEACMIREIYSDAMIFLMNPSTQFDVLRSYNIEMTLPSLEFYEAYKNELKDIPLHLEFENLLHRSGLKGEDEMLEVLNDKTLTIHGLWTHFGYADEFDSNEYSKELNDWTSLVDALLNAYSFKYIHAQNSASFFRSGVLPNHTHTRLGIALYGARPYSNLNTESIQQSLSIYGEIIQVRTLNKGEYSGYSFGYYCEKDNTKVAVVNIGYGDGILKKRAKYGCKINGRFYKIATLMMSHMLVIVDENVSVNDGVTIYDQDLRIDDFTFLGVGANSEQLSALNHNSLVKEFV